MFSRDVNNHDYHSGLALNNIGVLLLEAGCYERALITLKDAVDAMRSVFASDRECRTTVEVQYKLLKANKRYQLHVSGTEERVLHSLVYEKRHIPLLRSHACLTELRPTKIQLPHFTESFSVNGRDPDIESVVVLANAGLSYYLVSKATKKRELAESLVQNSYHVLNLAADIVTTRFACCEDSSEEVRLMTVAILVTGMMAHIYHETGRVSDAKKFETKYHRLVESTQQMHQSMQHTSI
jgi:hypothetical protein